MLRNGITAPLFSLPNQFGAPFSSAEFSGKVTVLIFHRGKFCPTTDRFLSAYQDITGRLREMNVALVAISADAVTDNQSLTERWNLNYPLLSDPSCTLGEQFEVYIDKTRGGRSFFEPALVVLDKEGKVAYSVISSGPKGLPSPGDLLPVLLYMFFHNGKY